MKRPLARVLVLALLGSLAATRVEPGACGDGLHLQDVVEASLSSGPSLQQSQDDMRKAQGDLRVAKGAFDWKADAKVGGQRLYFPRATAQGLLTNTLDSSLSMHETAGVGRLLRNGIEGSVGMSIYSNTGASSAQTMGETKPRPQLQLSVPLLRGFGANSPAAAAERAAAETVDGARLQLSFAAQQAVHDAVQAYWRCYAAQQDTDIAREDQKGADDYLASVHEQARAGLVEPSVLGRIQARQGLQRAEVTRLEQAEALCRRDLATLMGGGIDAETEPLAEDFPAAAPLRAAAGSLGEAALVEMSMRRRPDVQALERYVSAETDRLAGARNGARPNVGILADTDSVYLRFSKAIGGDAESGHVEQALASEDAARLRLRQLQTGIRRDVFEQLRSLRSALASSEVLAESVNLLGQSVADGAQRARAGNGSWQEYREIQHDLATVRHELVAQRLAVASSLTALRLATGTIDVEGQHSSAALATLFRSLPEIPPAGAVQSPGP